MLKKVLISTTAGLVATCGAMSVAHAGALKLRLADVNVGPVDEDGQRTDPDATKHRDYDDGLDINGSQGPQGQLAPNGAASVDKGFYPDPDKPEFKHVIVAEERMGGAENPVGGLYEIDVFEVTEGATFSGVARFDIFLEGSALPMFKTDLNCVNAVRAGSDNVHSVAARTAGGGQPILAGETEANCNVFPQDGGGVLKSDRAVGWALPIETKECGDLTIRMIVTTRDPITDVTTPDEFAHTIQTCEDAILAEFTGADLKIDYATNFRSFLVGKSHRPALYARIGLFQLRTDHYLVDLKPADPTDKTVHETVFDVTDVEKYTVQLTFGDGDKGGLRGIKRVDLGPKQAVDGGAADAFLDRDNDTANFMFNREEIIEYFGIEPATSEDKGDFQIGNEVYVDIHAFGPRSLSPFNGPIDHQTVRVTVNEFDLTPTTCVGDHCVKFFSPEQEALGDLSDLLKTGINFGPFDWVADANSVVRSFFRVTGIPKEDIDDLKGLIIVENASDGKEFDGEYKVDFPDENVVNHELLLSTGAVRDLLAEAGMPDAADWGRADLTFTFFVPGKQGLKMDMDRLLNTNGVFAPYGDNANDANSLKARSCDDGRFGSHVANKLSRGFERYLLSRCSAGEIRRRFFDIKDGETILLDESDLDEL